MSKKKKLIRLETNKILLNQIYEESIPKGFNFAFVGKGERREKELRIKSINTPFVNCRETLCNACRAQVNKEQGLIYWKFDSNKNPIDMSRLRIAFLVDKKIYNDGKDRIFSGKKIINLIEEEAGWEKSIISSAIHMDHEDSYNLWLFTGPEQWIRVPPMLSLFGLIMRVCYQFGPIKSNSLEEFKLYIEKLAVKKHAPIDIYFLSNIKDYIIPLVKNYDKIFTKKNLEYYYPKQSVYLTGHGGINSLLKKHLSYSSEMDKNLDKYVFKTNK